MIYINGAERPDIDVAVGGKLSETAGHVTDASINIKLPEENEPPKSQDYFKLTDGPNQYSGESLSFDSAPNVPLRSLLQSGRTAQTVTATGKNILDLTKLNIAGNQAVVNAIGANKLSITDNRATIPQNSQCSYWLKNLTVGSTYTVSASVSGNGVAPPSVITVDEYDSNRNRTLINVKTFTVKSGYTYTIKFYTNYSATGTVSISGPVTMVYDNIQLELGSTATAYEPFVPNSPSPDYLAPITGVTKTTVNDVDYATPQTLYDGDSYEYMSGTGQAVKTRQTVDGTKSWGYPGSGASNLFYARFNINANSGFPLIASNDSSTINCQCENFTPSSLSQVQALNGERVSAYAQNGYTRFDISILKSRLSGWLDSWTDAQKLSAFKAWLAANPVTVLYQLATPTAITGTPQTIPTALHNTITNDGGGDIVAATESTIYSGIILGADQINLGYADGIGIKQYKLTLGSNAYVLANVMVDMQFPAGANVQQVLFGNHSGDAWYNASLGSFYGIIPVRVTPENIVIGTIDDFTNVLLSEVAYLWGQPVKDVLDQICGAADAWWEITPDRAFNMRYNLNRGNAPVALDQNSSAYDVAPSEDAYTMYSAVRVVGGQGEGGEVSAGGDSMGGNEYLESLTYTEIIVKYPIASFPDGDNYVHIHNSTGDTAVKIGFSGIHDADPSYGALASYGSNKITAKDGVSWGPGDEEWFVSVNYNILAPVVVRMVDPSRVAEIQAQRGGTGVVEYTLKDDTLTSFNVAADAATIFLQNSATRAYSVEFKIRVPGFHVGQILQCGLPYYGLTGEYKVLSVDASCISYGDSVIWEYTIQASTAAYRDSVKLLFNVNKKIAFKLGSDFPAADGRMISSQVSIYSSIEIRAVQPLSWEEWEVQDLTWAAFEALSKMWKELENTVKEWMITGNYLTTAAKQKIVAALNGGSITAGDIGINGMLRLYNAAGSIIGGTNPTGTPTIVADSITNSYYFGTSDAQASITKLQVGPPSDPVGSVQQIPVSIDKSSTNPLGAYALTIVKKDQVI